MDDVLCKNLDAVLERMARSKNANKRVVFAVVCKDSVGVVDSRDVEELRQYLLGDGYIEGSGFSDGCDPYSITPLGISFLREGGYTLQYKNKVRDDKIKDGQLNSSKYTKWGIAVAVITLLSPIVYYIVKYYFKMT